MKQVLIVGGSLDTERRQQVFDEYAEGVKRVLGSDAEVLTTNINNLQLVIDNDRFEIYDTANNLQLTDMDLIALHARMRRTDMGYVLSRFCANHSIQHFNDFSAYYSGSKIAQMVVLFESGARIAKTVYATDAKNYLRVIEKELQPPFILKDSNGTKGAFNYLVHDFDEARRRLAEEPAIKFIAQAFCPNDRDYRVLLSPNQVLTIERRGGPNTHLNNTSLGAAAALVNGAVPEEVISKSREVADKLGLTLAGVDVMPHLKTGEFYFLEINSQPQLFSGACLDQKAAFVRQLFLDQLDKS